MNSACKICGGVSASFGSGQVLGRHAVEYYRCGSCGFIQTEEPFWLEEAYGEALSSLDVGAVSRNLRLALPAQCVIRGFFNPSGRFVDYGGGAGLFVRLMRDAGFDFRWSDKFARNVFAKGFEAGPGPFELLTAFEVFEHLEQPVRQLEDMLALSRNVLFTTVLLPNPAPAPGQWWYYGLEHGQHVAFYTPQALQALARRFNLHFSSAGELHLLSEKPISSAQFRSATRSKLARWRARWSPRQSLIEADYQRLAAERGGGPPQS